MQLITSENCVLKTGYPISYFIKLTGIHRIHPHFKLDDAKDSLVYLNGKKVTIEIETDKVFVSRTINFKKLKITNNLMEKIDDNVKGLALNLLSEQVMKATLAGYRLIDTIAYRGLNDRTKTKDEKPFDGFKIWAKLGFVMDDDSQTAFLKLMQDLGRNEKTLRELQLNGGEEVWNEHGKRWAGTFDLRKFYYSRNTVASDSMRVRQKLRKLQTRTV